MELQYLITLIILTLNLQTEEDSSFFSLCNSLFNFAFIDWFITFQTFIFIFQIVFKVWLLDFINFVYECFISVGNAEFNIYWVDNSEFPGLEFFLLFPEFFLLIMVISLFFFSVSVSEYGVSIGSSLTVQVNYLCLITTFYIAYLYVNVISYDVSFFQDSYVRDAWSITFVLLVILSWSLFILLAGGYYSSYTLNNFELNFLYLFVLFGSILIIFANDFLLLYVGIELQSLCLYILATSKPNSTFATESGTKYFVLGAFASAFFLFGVSIIYGTTGLLNFTDLRLVYFVEPASFGLMMLGIFFVLISFFFKVGLVPFHFWLPDVYEGSPMLITAFFSVLPKISLFFFISKMFSIYPFFVSLNEVWVNIIGLLSILVGSIGAIAQSRIKRLLSYSAIGHSGFILLSLGTGTFEGFVSFLIYLLVYTITLISIFTLLIGFSNRITLSSIKHLSNLRFLYQNNMLAGIFLVVLFFSIAGIPPLAGFFSKTYVFLAIVSNGSYAIALIGIFFSVIGGSYYLRCVREITFLQNKKTWLFLKDVTRLQAFVIVFGVMFNITFVLLGSDLLHLIYNLKLA